MGEDQKAREIRYLTWTLEVVEILFRLTVPISISRQKDSNERARSGREAFRKPLTYVLRCVSLWVRNCVNRARGQRKRGGGIHAIPYPQTYTSQYIC